MKVSFKDENISIKVSHLYTYGTDNPSSSRHREGKEQVSIDVDINEIESIVGDIVDPVKFNMFKYAALGIKRNGKVISIDTLKAFSSINNAGTGYLTQRQMEVVIYNRELTDHERRLGDNLYFQDGSRKYNADIAYILGSYTASLSDNNKFYFKDGKLSHIEYETKVDFNNFDGNSDSFIANMVNPLIFNRVDPLKIGRAVKINTIGSVALKRISSTNIREALESSFIDQLSSASEGSYPIPNTPIDNYSYKGKANLKIDFSAWYQRWEHISKNIKTPFVTDKFLPAPFRPGISQDQAKFVFRNLEEFYTKKISEPIISKNKIDILTTKNTKDINDPDYFNTTMNKFVAVNKDTLNSNTSAFAVSLANIATDNFRVANNNLSKNPLNTSGYKSKIGVENALNGPFVKPITINWLSGIGRSQLPVDPLILDLNGDGAKAVSYNDKPVLFDIDNDGGSLEETGWLNNQDGLLVRDLNNNGKIDNMSEVFSEYYAGKAGRNGESGEKRFKNGFEALRTLDSNKDNIFDSKDTDFNKVRIWQDKNHNGLTDSGELQTLSSLGITAIDLTYQEMGGQLFSGNELLAKGNFTHNGKKQEAVAVNFLANPRGHTITNIAGGKKTVTEGSGLIDGTSSFTATDNQNRDLNARQLGVINIQAGNGNDILRGDAQNNWLAGGGGADTFYGGDGDDVLLIDGDDLPENIHGGNGDDIVQVIGDKSVSLDLGRAEIEIAHGGRGDDVFISSGNSSIFVRGWQ